ncbi:MAG: hypothetical protein IT431_12500 [Phycisphaerales bacterium]|nr:hypothetical protein [Phycisphaerales bacterium]
MLSSRRGLLGRLGAALLALCAIAPAIGLAPEPAPVPKRWQLDVTPGDLRVAYVNAGDNSAAYLYFTYSVTNNTGNDLDFVPSFALATDSGVSLASGVGVPAAVTKQLLAALEHPFMQDQIEILGPIQQGPENAKHGVVIWPVVDYQADEVRIFGAGFSGETETIELTDPRTGEAKRLIFRKTLMMRFGTPGELRVAEMGDEPFGVAEKRWIMR